MILSPHQPGEIGRVSIIVKTIAAQQHCVPFAQFCLGKFHPDLAVNSHSTGDIVPLGMAERLLLGDLAPFHEHLHNSVVMGEL